MSSRRAVQKEVFVPLTFALGQQFQFDWGEADVRIHDEVTRIFLFCMELSASRKKFVWAYHSEQESFIALQAHYVFEAEFCNTRRGNEKGMIEGLVGYVRRNALAPVPEVMSLEELNTKIRIPWLVRADGRPCAGTAYQGTRGASLRVGTGGASSSAAAAV